MAEKSRPQSTTVGPAGSADMKKQDLLRHSEENQGSVANHSFVSLRDEPKVTMRQSMAEEEELLNGSTGDSLEWI